MPQSLSAMERGDPPPRRKSCMACVRAKRRCDLGQPACLRCSRRNIQCCYASERGRTATRPRRSAGARVAGNKPSHGAGTAPDTSGIAPTMPTTSDSPEMLPAVNSVIFNDDVDIIGTNQAPNLCDPMIGFTEPLFGQPTLDINGLEASADLVTRPLLPLLPLGISTVDLFNSAAASRAQLILRGIQYTIDQIRRAPRQMVHENATPWCHPKLYQDSMPPAMQDAQACCALYLAKNPINAPAILRTIEAKAKDLTATPVLPSTSPLDILARVQALMLYQIIRLFDDDIRARASAEQTVPQLEALAMALSAHVDTGVDQATQELDGSLIDISYGFWLSWIFQESARRTLLTAFLLDQMYRLISDCGPVYTRRNLCQCYSWTVSSYLWSASDAGEFAAAWLQGKHYVVTAHQIVNLLAYVDPDDIDGYSRIILTSILGLEATQDWLLRKGRSAVLQLSQV